jgi:site-specific DNA recombinase
MIIKEVFGYRRSLADKHKLEIDLEAANIVQNVFNLYLSGIGYRKIAEILNNEGCPTPSQYKIYKTGVTTKSKKVAALWNSVHVQRILKNDIYIGTLRLGKTEKRIIKGKSQKQPVDKQYVFENNHPAIVSKEQFEEVQRIVERRNKDHSKGSASLHNIFSGLIYCQSCGSYMIAYKKQGKPKSYICGSYHKYGRQSCMRHTIQEDLLQQAVQQFLKAMAMAHIEEIKKIQLGTNVNINSNNMQLINTLLREKQQRKAQLKQLIMQRIIDIGKENNTEYQNIMNDSFAELEKELKERLLYIEKKMQELQQSIQAADGCKQVDSYDFLLEIINNTILEKRYVEVLIDKILIESDGSPTIYMKANIEALCSHNREDANLVLGL